MSFSSGPSFFERLAARFTGAKPRLPRLPSMDHMEGYLVPAKDPSLADKLTIVLDLDETIIYAREGPLFVRPGTKELFAFLKEHFEVIVWTAAVRPYAKVVIKNIDTVNATHHLIYRHNKWFTGQAGYRKDLSMLGRDLQTTLIVENTPDCVKGHEEHGVLVNDYIGGERQDNTIPSLLNLLQEMIEKRKEHPGLTVPELLTQSALLSRRGVPSDFGPPVNCHCLDWTQQFDLQKALRTNKDLVLTCSLPQHIFSNEDASEEKSTEEANDFAIGRNCDDAAQ
jgi:RNA polymerase II subunit A small phosphatase-like protein